MPLLRRYAWLIPGSYGLLLSGAGLAWLLTGAPLDTATYAKLVGGSWPAFIQAQPPATSHLLNTLFRVVGGNTAILGGGLTFAIAITSYRSGQLWAWITAWLLPLHAALDLLLVWGAGALTLGAVVWDSLLLCLTLVAQLVTRPSRRLTSA
jgi:hypothetical protein